MKIPDNAWGPNIIKIKLKNGESYLGLLDAFYNDIILHCFHSVEDCYSYNSIPIKEEDIDNIEVLDVTFKCAEERIQEILQSNNNLLSYKQLQELNLNERDLLDILVKEIMLKSGLQTADLLLNDISTKLFELGVGVIPYNSLIFKGERYCVNPEMMDKIQKVLDGDL